MTRATCGAQASLDKLNKVQDAYLGIETSLETVIAEEDFIRYGVMKAPGLVIDERLVVQGKLPGPLVILGWLHEAIHNEALPA